MSIYDGIKIYNEKGLESTAKGIEGYLKEKGRDYLKLNLLEQMLKQCLKYYLK